MAALQNNNNAYRQRMLRRWIPVGLFGLNYGLWLATALAAGAWGLLHLALLPPLIIAVYLWRTK